MLNREVKKVLGNRAMIRKLEAGYTTSSGIVIKDDGESLPLAEVIMVSEEVPQIEEGDIVHYTVARESGKCRHKGEEVYVVPVANIVAIINK